MPHHFCLFKFCSTVKSNIGLTSVTVMCVNLCNHLLENFEYSNKKLLCEENICQFSSCVVVPTGLSFTVYVVCCASVLATGL